MTETIPDDLICKEEVVICPTQSIDLHLWFAARSPGVSFKVCTSCGVRQVPTGGLSTNTGLSIVLLNCL
jgi:hypothetical protein